MQWLLKIAKFQRRSFLSTCSMCSSISAQILFLILFTGSVLGSLSAENSSCPIHEILTFKKPAILLADSMPNNVRTKSVITISDCIQSCCEWEECQVVVLENSTCYNVSPIFKLFKLFFQLIIIFYARSTASVKLNVI